VALSGQWFVRSGGSNLNGGSGNTDAAKVTRDAGTPGVLVAGVLTDGGVDFVAAGVVVGDVANLDVGGNRQVYEITVVNTNDITLASPPADASYNYRVGGAFLTVKKAVNSGATLNRLLAAGDTVWVQPVTFVDNLVDVNVLITLRGNGGVATLDGTGGAAGSDVLVSSAGGVRLWDFELVNGVDRGLDRTAGNVNMVRAAARSNGGIGFSCGAGFTGGYFSSARSNGGDGWTGSAGTCLVGSAAGDNTGDGFDVVMMDAFVGLLAYDNGGDGLRLASGGPTRCILAYCTFEGNTGDGCELTATSRLGAGSAVMNNLFTNNGGYGVNSSAGAQAAAYTAGYNDYFGNTTAARNNFNSDAGDIAVDPAYTNAGSDRYQPRSSLVVNQGYSAFVTGNPVTFGAVSPSAPGAAAIFQV
jgi:hypothetical protein